jgi:predicted membrane channel-forming protein YqfA (hemolysin III family)
MRVRTRKLVGTLLSIAFLAIYALLAMALAESRIQDASNTVRLVVYVVLGIAWVLPLMPLIQWMQRPGPARVSNGPFPPAVEPSIRAAPRPTESHPQT